MTARLLAALALAAALSGAAQAQTARVVTDCALDAALPSRDATGLIVDQTGRLCVGSTTLASAGTNRSATVGTVAVTLMAANTARRGWRIRNDSAGDVWINFDATATAAAGGGNIKIPANSSLTSEPGFVETGAMSAIGSAAALAITAREH